MSTAASFSICDSVSHAHSWKLLKPHMFAIVQDVLFPLMSYSEADEELWNTDPHEYIRIKFGKCANKQRCTSTYIYSCAFATQNAFIFDQPEMTRYICIHCSQPLYTLAYRA